MIAIMHLEILWAGKKVPGGLHKTMHCQLQKNNVSMEDEIECSHD